MILALIAVAEESLLAGGADDVAGLVAAGSLSGFQSLPLTLLYSTFKAKSTLTAASISALAAFFAFKSRTVSPCCMIFWLISVVLLVAGF